MLDTTYKLKLRQSAPLDVKIKMTERRIREFMDHFGRKVYVSFSGGKDSTVLLDIVRKVVPDVKAVFCNTGLEYPEIVKFVKQTDNVDVIRPKMNFKQVIEKYGYPVVGKEQARYIGEVQRGTTEYTTNKRLHGKNGTRTGMISKKWQYLIDAPFKISGTCCDVMKKRPFKAYQKSTGERPFIGTMAGESSLRKQNYDKYGCNMFNEGKEQSRPLMFWTEADIWQYIAFNNLPYSEIYDTGVSRTGCMFCMFGVQFEKSPNRFELMRISHPKLYDYCMNKLGLKLVLAFLKVSA